MLDTFGRFEFNPAEGSIGSGQFGHVYKGIQKTSNGNIPIAVKKIDFGKNSDTWKREISVLQEISHISQQNLVRLLEYAMKDNFLYLFMEYCNGGDLETYIKQNGKIDDSVVAHFACQITNGMKVLHSLNIVHRDLKPQNILLHHVGGGVDMPPLEIVLKITDFGFSRFLSEDQMTRSYLGSPSYMAPEIFMRLAHTPVSDIFSVGMILYFCRFNRLPFPASSENHLKTLYISNAQPPFPPETNDMLRDLVARMLQLSPETRIGFDEWFKHPFLESAFSGVDSVKKPIQMSYSSFVKDRTKSLGDGIFEFNKDGFIVVDSNSFNSPGQIISQLSRESVGSPIVDKKKPSYPPIMDQLFHFPPASDFFDIYGQDCRVEEPFEMSFATEYDEDLLKNSFPYLVDRDLACELCEGSMTSLVKMSTEERDCFDRVMHYIIVLDTHKCAVKYLLENDLLDILSCLMVRTESILRRLNLMLKETVSEGSNTFGVWRRSIRIAIRITREMIDMAHPAIENKCSPADDFMIAEDFLYHFVGKMVIEGCESYSPEAENSVLLKSHTCFVRSWHTLYSLAEGADSAEDRMEYNDGVKLILKFLDHMTSRHKNIISF